ncbi:hypothetical protein P278_28220 [Zhouia amylolytica AD3]|uniref:Uncharacterized protein n=1 Tax=Zhouia amylolytica AD3 TaxID=1286632 RepID=W2UJ25_9FLAO|nr:hypothetical protein P278_28220 [Zhouia amylolytica AD3]
MLFGQYNLLFPAGGYRYYTQNKTSATGHGNYSLSKKRSDLFRSI